MFVSNSTLKTKSYDKGIAPAIVCNQNVKRNCAKKCRWKMHAFIMESKEDRLP